MKKSTMILAGLLVAAPLFAAPLFAAPKTTDFDVSSHTVDNHIAGGKVEITSLTKIEALEGGDILSESSFFFPAKPEAIAQQLSTPDGICKMAAFCKGVANTGKTADGQGWTGEMTINAQKIAKVAGKGDWVRDLKTATAQNGELQDQLRAAHHAGAGRDADQLQAAERPRALEVRDEHPRPRGWAGVHDGGRAEPLELEAGADRGGPREPGEEHHPRQCGDHRPGDVRELALPFARDPGQRSRGCCPFAS